MTAQEQIVGGWTSLHVPDAKELAIFKEVTAPLLGVQYEALEVRSQIVNGTNYQYIANQTVVGSTLVRRVAVAVYDPINGQPHITSITPLLLD